MKKSKMHKVKCPHCRMKFLVPRGEFPAKLFKHIGKKHPGARRKERRSKPSTASRGSRRTHHAEPASESPPQAPDGFIVETVTYRRL